MQPRHPTQRSAHTRVEDEPDGEWLEREALIVHLLEVHRSKGATRATFDLWEARLLEAWHLDEHDDRDDLEHAHAGAVGWLYLPDLRYCPCGFPYLLGRPESLACEIHEVRP